MDKNEVKNKVQSLVDRYEGIKKERGLLRNYTEEETKKDFILPLFELLGWDVYNKKEVSAEESISGDRVDYGFYIDERIKFYLEAKKLGADLHKEEYAQQAIKYSWNRGVNWALLSDFEGIKIFNTQDPKASLASKLLFSISYSEYITRFEELYLLSKESFEKGLIDLYAERHGKKFEKIPVSELLYKDLNECREILTKSLSAWNQELEKNKTLLDEGVQKLLGRLVFIRVAEDRRIEQPTLIPLVREWQNRKDRNKVPLYTHMISKFRELDKVYDSDLFTKHPFEEWEEYDGATEKVIEILYGKPGYYEYDFKAIPSDVLGAVYENYLGYKLSQSKRGVEVHKDAKKRKEQGIYYTPHYIVEYIVKNSLGPILDRCQSAEDLQKVRVLDPACGSGSFLLEAFRLIAEKYKSFNLTGFLTNIQILTQNIYGVDLDDQAVEITKLNLFVAALDERIKLPRLNQNIKNGNSLIFSTDAELKKYFGSNFKKKTPFNWEQEFSEVFKQGGFDVVIGNPPWVSNDNVELDEKEFFKEFYQVGKSRFDIATLFAEKSVKILKEGGFLGLVMPEHIWIGEYFKPFREYLEEKTQVLEVLSSGEGVFSQVANPSSLFLALKTTTPLHRSIFVGSFQEGCLNKHEFKGSIADRIIFDNFTAELQKKFSKKSFSLLGDLAVVTDGIQTANLLKEIFVQNPKEDKNYIKALRSGSSIKSRYSSVEWDGWWVLKPELTKKYKRPGFSYDSPKRMKCFNASVKIILRQTEPTILATLDVDKYYFPNSIFQIAIEGSNHKILKFLLGILNSKLIRFYYSKLAQVEGTTKPQIYLNILKSLPIPEFSSEITVLVDKMLELNKNLSTFEENSNKWEQIKSEIEKTDEKIDEKVSVLYDITPDEIKLLK